MEAMGSGWLAQGLLLVVGIAPLLSSRASMWWSGRFRLFLNCGAARRPKPPGHDEDTGLHPDRDHADCSGNRAEPRALDARWCDFPFAALNRCGAVLDSGIPQLSKIRRVVRSPRTCSWDCSWLRRSSRTKGLTIGSHCGPVRRTLCSALRYAAAYCCGFRNGIDGDDTTGEVWPGVASPRTSNPNDWVVKE